WRPTTGRTGPADGEPRRRARGASAHVALDGPFVPDRRLVGIQAGGPAGPALVEQVPALVQGDLDPFEPLPLRLGHLAAGLPAEELVLLVGEVVDPVDDGLILHGFLLCMGLVKARVRPGGEMSRQWREAPHQVNRDGAEGAPGLT